MALRQCMLVFCLLLLVTLGNSYSMKYVVDRLHALETKLESESKLRRELETKLESESKLRRSETEELFRMISDLAGGKIPSRVGQLTSDENITPSAQLTTKTPSPDKYKTTQLAKDIQNIESNITEQQNVKLRSKLRSISKQLKADNDMFESRIKEEIRNFTNNVSDNLTLLVNVERFNNLSDFVTTRLLELRNEARQSLISLKSDVKMSIQKLSNDVHTVNQTAMKNVESCNNVSDKTLTTNTFYAKSCKNAPKSNGFYNMYIAKSRSLLRVYCDQTTDGGGWLVIQRRQDGSVDFERTWVDYKTGFGDPENEFWIGNDNIHALTSAGLNELRIDMEDFEENKAYAKYKYFKVNPESKSYRLEIEGYIGDAGDSLGPQNGMAFSTRDNDNDKIYGASCSQSQRGGWWYSQCGSSNLNGYYYLGSNSPYENSVIIWKDWKGSKYSLKTVEMKIR